MPDHNPEYVDQLAAQLRQQRPDLLTAAEDDFALLSGRLALVTEPDHTTRRTLAAALGLPEPRQETT